jgi:hypothetical protein
MGCRNVKGLSRGLRTKLLPVIRELEGFKSFELIQFDESTVAFVVMFETPEQLETASAKTQAIVRAQLTRFIPNPPDVLVGDVLWETRW